MKKNKLVLALAAAMAVVMAVSGCGGGSEPTAQGGMAGAMADAVPGSGAYDAALDAPLQEGQEIQGTIAAQVEGREVVFRSVLTRVPDDVDAQIRQAVASKEGKDVIADVNARVRKGGSGVQVTGEDVTRIVGGMAGKVFADAEVRAFRSQPLLLMQLQGAAPDGRRLTINLNLDRESLAYKDGSISYQPSADAFAGRYGGDTDAGQFEVEIEQLARHDDGSFLVCGRFQARHLEPDRSATKPGGTVDVLSGRFTYDRVPFRD